MGLSAKLSGGKTAAAEFHRAPGRKVVALMGNPNVGKSTVFNALPVRRTVWLWSVTARVGRATSWWRGR